MTGSEQFLDTAKIVLALGIHEGQVVSDFGCGSGYFTIDIAKQVGKTGKVYAFDIQEAPLETVKSKAKGAELDNVQALRANLEVQGGTNLPDTINDIVLLANILFQSSQKEDVIKEARRVLKPEGELVVIDWKKSAVMGPPMALRTSEDDMRRIVESAGFKFVRAIEAGQFHFGMVFTK